MALKEFLAEKKNEGFNLSKLNYVQLIELEKEIQKEKEKKSQYILTKGDLINSDSDKMHTIYDTLDVRFRDEKYGWPQKLKVDKFDWPSEEEKEKARLKELPAPCVESVYSRITSSLLYLCDIAFKNYRDHLGPSDNMRWTKHNHYGSTTGPNDDERYFTIMVNKEIPWGKAKDYKAMYEELVDIFKKYMEA